MSRRITEKLMGPGEYDVDEVVHEDRGARSAAKLYEMWHKKQPDGVHKLLYEFPDTVCSIGTAESIVYHSDKWEADGKGYDYEHDFDSGPKVYAPSDSPFFARSNPVVETAKIIRADIDGDIPLPMLAVVLEFGFKDVRGESKTISFKGQTPLMCMTADKKTLIIFANIDGVETPIFVRGGEMHVTSHGIIK